MDTIARITIVAIFPLLSLAQLVTGRVIFRGYDLSKMKRRRTPLFEVVMFALVLPALIAYVGGTTGPMVPIPESLRALGFVAIVIGFGITLWANWVLGQNWVPGIGYHEQHRLITSGPYRWVRHPMYTGIGIVMLGVAGLASFAATATAGCFFFWSSFAYRYAVEEAFMMKLFGEKYASYKAHTGAFLPRARRVRPSSEPVVIRPEPATEQKQRTNVARKEAARQARPGRRRSKR